MKYVGGIIALETPCERNSVGTWGVPKRYYIDENLFKLKDTEDSPFGEYGIEKDKIIKHREYCLYNVADHVRVYLDMLYECQFDELRGLYHECIKDLRCRSDIFAYTFYKLRNLDVFPKVNKFMCEEFGNAWLSYLNAIDSVAEHIGTHQVDMQQLVALQQKSTHAESISA